MRNYSTKENLQMNRRSVLFPFLALLVFVISVGCLCTGLANQVTPTATALPPTQAPLPTKAPLPTAAPVTEAPVANNDSGGWTTFTDENNFYAIDVPSDWTYDHNVADDNTYYIDTFTSPDGGAVVENIVYNDGTPFTGGQNGQFALNILNKLYSKTGKEGDIKVSSDQIMKDGSERLTWSSKEGQYSGISFFEIRDKNWFLMFTVDWGNSVESQYSDILNSVIESYRIP
jgi:hypothetical protein